MKRTLRLVAVTIALISALVFWYCIAADYDYSALSGMYTFQRGQEKCVLHLYENRTFVQKITAGNSKRTARGTWRRVGEGGVALSSDFLHIEGQKPGPSGENYGHFEKLAGISPVLTLDPVPGGPQFHRSMLSFIRK